MYEHVQSLLVFIVRAHVSRKICLAAYSLLADRAVNRCLLVKCHKYKGWDVRQAGSVPCYVLQQASCDSV